MTNNEIKSALIDQRTPVLLQQGFLDFAAIGGGILISNKEYRARTDRGFLKYWDMVPGTMDTPELNQDVRMTLAAGGQNLLEEEQLGMWSPQAQFGKDKNWRVRSIVNNAQTIQFTMDGTNAILEQQAILIVSYSTPAHEKFLKTIFKQKFGLGLKRKTYLLKVPALTPVGDISVEDILPRNNGAIIGVGISNAYDLLGTTELSQQFMNVSIDGINIIENVPATYYNLAEGRENYLQPVLLRPGSTLTFSAKILTPTVTDIYHSVTFYFDN